MCGAASRDGVCRPWWETSAAPATTPVRSRCSWEIHPRGVQSPSDCGRLCRCWLPSVEPEALLPQRVHQGAKRGQVFLPPLQGEENDESLESERALPAAHLRTEPRRRDAGTSARVSLLSTEYMKNCVQTKSREVKEKAGRPCCHRAEHQKQD